LSRLPRRYERRRTVPGIDHWTKAREEPSQLEHVDGIRRRERIDAARSRLLVLQPIVTTADAVELVGRVQPEDVRPGVPLDDERIHVDRVARELERAATAVGEGERGSELLWPRHARRDGGRDDFTRERPIAERGETDRSRERRQRQAEEADQQGYRGADHASPADGDQRHEEEDSGE